MKKVTIFEHLVIAKFKGNIFEVLNKMTSYNYEFMFKDITMVEFKNKFLNYNNIDNSSLSNDKVPIKFKCTHSESNLIMNFHKLSENSYVRYTVDKKEINEFVILTKDLIELIQDDTIKVIEVTD